MNIHPLSFAAMLIALVSFSSSAARAEEFSGTGSDADFYSTDLDQSEAIAISGDGTIVFGNSYNGSSFHKPFTWTAADGYVDFDTGNDDDAYFVGANDDGSVALLVIDGASTIWKQGSGFQDFTTLVDSDDELFANAVSGDGKVIVGYNENFDSFAWSADENEDILFGNAPFETTGTALGVNQDGSVIVGISLRSDTHKWEGWRWEDDIFERLEAPGGYGGSFATGVSDDGEVVIGYLNVGGTYSNTGSAFRWTEGGGFDVIGKLADESGARFNAASADGSVIVGYGVKSSDSTLEALRWTEDTGLQLLSEMLEDGGVDLTGWELNSANGVSNDGAVIVGRGKKDGVTQGFVTLCPILGCAGMVEMDQLAASIAGQGAVGQTSNSYVDGELNTQTQQMGQHQTGGAPTSFSGAGFYDSDPIAAFSIGVTHDLYGDVFLGGSLGGGRVTTDMVYDGSSRMNSAIASAYVASNPLAGLQWMFGVDGSYFSGSIKRGYLNGAALDRSKGDTSGSGFGALARLGYSLPAGERVRLTPFGSLHVAYSKLDGYTETTGSLPASFASMSDTSQIGRVGSDVRFTLADNKWLFGTLAWAHRFDDARTSNVSAMVLGVLPVNTAGGQVAKNWAEATAGLHVPLGSDGLVLDTSVTGVLPTSGYDKTYQIRLGLTLPF